MLSENLVRFADLNDWQKSEKEGIVFGLYCDYPFTIADGRNFKAFITPVAGISQSGLKHCTITSSRTSARSSS